MKKLSFLRSRDFWFSLVVACAFPAFLALYFVTFGWETFSGYLSVYFMEPGHGVLQSIYFPLGLAFWLLGSFSTLAEMFLRYLWSPFAGTVE